jgi:hypothetical protein
MCRYWYLGASLGTAQWTASWAELLMHQRDRPDGLIILDDNLAGPALQGLAQAGVRLGQDLDVVTHCNFPSTQRLPKTVWGRAREATGPATRPGESRLGGHVDWSLRRCRPGNSKPCGTGRRR